jgi:DNA-binding response OmpR family regulator
VFGAVLEACNFRASIYVLHPWKRKLPEGGEIHTMEDHILVNDAASPVSAEFVAALARHGWLVSVVTNPDDLRAHIARYGSPAPFILTGSALGPEEETISELLTGTGRTAILAVVDNEDGMRPDNEDELWLRADDFVVGPVSTVELVLRVQRLMRQRAPEAVSAETHSGRRRESRSGISAERASAELADKGWLYGLSSIESEIVRKLAEADGAVVTLEELSDCIAASSMEARISGLRVHISRLRNKLDAHQKLPIEIVTVRGVGYRLGVWRE